jgi:hypothetical protein
VEDGQNGSMTICCEPKRTEVLQKGKDGNFSAVYLPI